MITATTDAEARKALTPTTRLDLAKARLLLKQQEVDKTLAILEKIQREQPDTPEYHFVRAQTESLMGRWRKAYNHSKKAVALDPNNEDITFQHEELIRNHRSFIRAGYGLRFIQDSSTERISFLQGEKRIREYSNVGILVERDNISAKNLTNIDTGISGNASAFRYRAEIYGKHYWENGNYSRVSLYANRETPGIAGEHQFWDKWGHTGVVLGVRTPDWRYTEGIFEDATRDYVQLYRFQRIRPRLYTRASVAFNNYAVDGINDVAQSVSPNFSLRYDFHPSNPLYNLLGEDSFVGVGYTFDAEYRFNVKTRTIGATTFEPLPIVNREIHGVDLSAGKIFNKYFRAEGSIGYAYDRFGSGGPSVRGLFIFTPIKPLEIAINASHAIGTNSANDIEDRIGIVATWRF